MNTDVLIVGAGPTGLMLANQLGRRGVRAVIIDRHSGPAQQTRAMAVHARTLEIYSKLGLVRQALELGRRGDGANMWANGKHTARIPLNEMGAGLSPYPFVLMLGQDDNERIMGAKLADWGVAVEWSTELIGLEQRADHVIAAIKRPDGSLFDLRARYVAGCDGSRSSVRELSDIKFPGAPYEHVFFVADTQAIGPMIPNELNVYLLKDGFHLFFPMAGVDRWRVIGILPPTLRGKSDLTFEEVIPSLTHEAGDALSFKSCSWFSTYRIHHRCVERFQDRRVFLLGDAAHVHSPMGGQGMNTGLQDAYNLAWKLALALEGRADERLLATYEAERLPVAHRLLETTDRAFQLVVSQSRAAGLLRTKVIARLAAFAMKRKGVRRAAFRVVSQIGIAYPSSPLSQARADFGAEAPRPGDRFPWMALKFGGEAHAQDLFDRLDDTRFNLLLIGQSAPSASLGERITVHTVTVDADNARELARQHVPPHSFYLLRPDGHIGLAGAQFELADIGRYFDSIGVQWDERRSAPSATTLAVA